MIVVPPITITDTLLTSSTVSEPNAPSDYNAGTTYSKGQMATDASSLLVYMSVQDSNTGNTPAISPSYWLQISYKEVAYNNGTTYALSTGAAPVYVYYNHRVYESIQASNTGHNPYSSPDWWEDIGPSLKYAMFDTLRNTASYAASPMTVVVTPGQRVDTLAALGVNAATVRVSMTSAGSTVYDQTVDLTTREAFNWYDWFFKGFSQSYQNLFQNLPPYTNGVITVVFTRSGGYVSCGALCMGQQNDLGITQKSPVRDVLNFSTIEKDEFGNSVLIQRRSVPKTIQKVWTDSGRVTDLTALAASLNAVPAVWAGLTDNTADYFPSLLILGIYKQFSINLMSTPKAELTLELEEV